jgi:hypothetical protein
MQATSRLGAVRVAVDDDLRRKDLAVLAEQFNQVVFRSVVREITDIELLGHCQSTSAK